MTRTFASLALLALARCAAHTDASLGAPTDVAAAELMEHHRHHHHGGVTQFIAMSLDTLGADDAKRAQIQVLQGQLRACMAPAREIEDALLQLEAAGVASGRIDPAAMNTTLGRLDGATAPIHGCSLEALNQLHALLSPAERAALLDKVQAHWTVWQEVNHRSGEQAGRLRALAVEVGLTPNQVEAISERLQPPSGDDFQDGELHVRAFTADFGAEWFDARSVFANADGHLVRHASERMARFYEAAAPLLTADQRRTLADHLREHAETGPALSENESPP